ncbi:uncharacterized protein SRS1_14119 [Sporisorium reilianum f. sp. reilianum]|uniref:Helicase/UvrB N-terminal domain-containing protein n=1 Tax=Sporisorium reilianum f. sp. reilianum TaxID=72559 RepID=A0A2N8UEV5_9BASI|nr:uncharacterized protein SRS1_14119 [Sporisorium reilianum f. sp. reilianum]
MAGQYLNEVFRFVDTDKAVDVVDLTGSSWESKKLPRAVKERQKTGEWDDRMFVVITNKVVVQHPRKKAQEHFIPTSSSNAYGLVVYDEVHGFPSHSAKSFQREFDIKRNFSIGFSATPIRDLWNFLPILSFCGNPLAKMGDAAEVCGHTSRASSIRNGDKTR